MGLRKLKDVQCINLAEQCVALKKSETSERSERDLMKLDKKLRKLRDRIYLKEEMWHRLPAWKYGRINDDHCVFIV